MIIKERNGWIAVIFLLFIFIIPVETLITGGSVVDTAADADTVLAGNGTAVDKAQNDNAEDVTNDIAKEKRDFAWLQDTLNGFTEKLFLRNVFISANSPIATDTPPAPKSLQRLISCDASLLRKSL